MIGIDTQDNTEDALEFVDEFGLTYEQLHDGSGDYADDLGTTGVPESVLIDPEGNVAYHVPGGGDGGDPDGPDRAAHRRRRRVMRRVLLLSSHCRRGLLAGRRRRPSARSPSRRPTSPTSPTR